jgi:thiamine transporter ThiT
VLETVLFFALVSIVTEVIHLMHLPKWLALLALAVTLLITGFNLAVGWGTVTGTLTAKLAFVGGFVAYPIVKWLSAERAASTSLRTKLWLLVR